ncbi:MAG: hypothetical protein K1X72_01955 [Pyrinomonadaceae bacterium]|nr:hypothetical protein [Pyrinomonadaceae bacterium]
MDAYHEVLVKLLDVTEGKDSRSVDLKDLVKKLGLHGNYSSIYERLNQEGWVAEDRKADFVRITHWGIAEAKKAVQKQGGLAEKPTSPNAAKCASNAREFAALLDNFANNATKENLTKLENKFSELETSFNLSKKDAR